MTANLNVEIARRSNVLRIPNAALRFRPTKDIFDALKQPMPEELNRGFGRGGGRGQNAQGGQGGPGGQPGPGTPSAGSGQPPASSSTQAADQTKNGKNAPAGKNSSAGSGQTPAGQNAQNQQGGQNPQGDRSAGAGQGGGRGGFANMTPEERDKRRQEMQDRLAKMTPEERADFEKRRAERMAQGGGGGGRGGFGGGQGNVQGGQGNAGGGRGGQNPNLAGNTNAPRGQKVGENASTNNPGAAAKAATIDSLFGPLPTVETRGRAWLYVDKQLKLVNLRLGISDGTNTEVLSDTALVDGQDVVVNVITPEMMKNPGANNANNPLMPQRGRGGPGGPGGGGGGRGGGR
jgi:hypothetical protein